MAFTRGLLVPLVYYLSLTLIFFFSELLIPVKLAWLLLMFYEGVCFYNEVFLDKELDYLAAALSGEEPIRAAIEFFVEMPLLAPIVLTRPPKLLPLAFYEILFFKIGVYLPGWGRIVEFKFCC